MQYAGFCSLRRISSTAGQHIGPLVITAELHDTAVFFKQLQEVIRLHDHIVEFEERQAFFQTFF